MVTGHPTTKGLLALAAAVTLAGCGGSPSARFYTLTPLAQPQAPAAAASRLAVSVQPVEIPEYLDRPEIVTQEGGNEVKVAQFHRWAGSLGENISYVLAEDLGQLLGSDRVLVNDAPPPERPDYTLALRVLRLDCVPQDHVLLKAQWRLVAGDGSRRITRVSSITEELPDARYQSMVAAANRALHRLSREIAAELTSATAATRGELSP